VDPERDTSGDYGYDLVHEEVKRQGAESPRDRPPGNPPNRPEGESAPDLGYDEAHGF
jgi:hypothetical protein